MSAQVDSKNSEKYQQEKNYLRILKNIIREWKSLSKKIIWIRLIHFTFFHLGFIAALSTYLFGLHAVPMKRLTLFWTLFYGNAAMFGITAGAHRLWTHHSFKARLPLRILLIILYSAAGIYSVRVWVRDHRQHHKYTDTDSDPHNASRGLFYSHIGWLVTKRTADNFRTRAEIDMSDIHADSMVMFQDKHWVTAALLFCFVLPTAIPVIFWGETILHAVLTQCFIRYICQVNAVFSINSLAHYWGYRPYNRFYSAAENPLVTMLTIGEGAHNYHHTFPWDYKATEFPLISFNFTAVAIRALAILGLAYDLKEPSAELVKKVKERNGCENLVSNNHSD